MKKEILLHQTKIQYELQYKTVKNMNLRIKPDGSVQVSANKRVPISVIEAFLQSKADWILTVLQKYEARSSDVQKQYRDEYEIRDVILELCERIYPYFEQRGIRYPKIKFRKMVSRWGSCHVAKGILTFNTNLMYAPIECVEYVVCHEFTHFLQPNHSEKFYQELSLICPQWKQCRKQLKEIVIRL